VLAAVYGPKSVTGKKENPEYASLEVIWKPKSGLSGNVFSSYLQFFLQLFLRYQDVNLSASDVVRRENNSLLTFCSNPCTLTGKFEKEAELIVKRSLESIILAALYPNLGISIILQVAITLACSISGDNM
jgi:exosome complex component RRP46